MEFTVYDIAIIPIIVAFVQVFGKKVFRIPSRWIPLLNLVLGQLAAFFYVAPEDPKFAVLAGLVMAFSAMGVWSGTKNIVGK